VSISRVMGMLELELFTLDCFGSCCTEIDEEHYRMYTKERNVLAVVSDSNIHRLSSTKLRVMY
jgi:hypothetical protein